MLHYKRHLVIQTPVLEPHRRLVFILTANFLSPITDQKCGSEVQLRIRRLEFQVPLWTDVTFSTFFFLKLSSCFFYSACKLVVIHLDHAKKYSVQSAMHNVLYSTIVGPMAGLQSFRLHEYILSKTFSYMSVNDNKKLSF